MDAEKLVKTYIRIRDAKEAVTKKCNEEVAALQAQMDTIEEALHEICKATGQNGGKTAAGTFTRSVKTRYEATNWDSMYKFIMENNIPEVFVRNLNQTNLKQFLDEHPDKLPEGLNVRNTYAITVRRPS